MIRGVKRAAVALVLALSLFSASAPSSAQATNRPPTVRPIIAKASGTTTTYQFLAIDPDNDPLSFNWTKDNQSDCGTFSFSGEDATWDHPEGAAAPGACPSESFHPGLITAVVADGSFICTGEYPMGSAEGTGPDPTCQAVAASSPSPSPSPTPKSRPSPSPSPSPTPSESPVPTVSVGPGPFVPIFGPPGSLEITLPPRARSGPPGERLMIAGSFAHACDRFLLHLDRTFITEAKPSANGYSFSGARFKIPYDALPGPHSISASCITASQTAASLSGAAILSAAGRSAAGGSAAATLPFTVDPSAPDIGSDHRSGFARSVPDPTTVVDGIKHNRKLVVRNILLALILLLMITFPAELFNSTLEENYDEVQGWFKRFRRIGRGFGRPLRNLPSMVSVALFAMVGGLIYGFLDPAFGTDRDSLINVAGMAAGILAITLTFDLTAVRSLRRRYPGSTQLRILPGTMVVAALCVLLSRVVDFSPGYFYGVIAGWVISAETSHKEEGRATAIGSTVMMVMSVGAWLLWLALKPMSIDPGASSAVLIADVALSTVFIAGLESLIFGLLPLKFMDGAKIVRWSRLAWVVLFGMALFGFVQILLNPSTGFITQNPEHFWTGIALFGGFGLMSFSFWAYFRFRRAPSP